MQKWAKGGFSRLQYLHCFGAEGEKTMIHLSLRRLVAGLLFTAVSSFACGGTIAASRPHGSAEAELQVAAQSAESSTPAQTDRSQWRKLQRRMSKDDVRKLLGEPTRVSVSKFYESWDYPRGNVIFDGKGRLDSWSEM